MTNTKYVLSTEYDGTYFKELYLTTLTLTHSLDTAREYDDLNYAHERRDEILKSLGIRFNVTRITTTQEIVDPQGDVIGGIE